MILNPGSEGCASSESRPKRGGKGASFESSRLHAGKLVSVSESIGPELCEQSGGHRELPGVLDSARYFQVRVRTDRLSVRPSVRPLGACQSHKSCRSPFTKGEIGVDCAACSPVHSIALALQPQHGKDLVHRSRKRARASHLQQHQSQGKTSPNEPKRPH